MNPIAIITDTDSSLPPDLASRHGIRQVPITIHFESESYTSGVDIDDHTLFEKINRLQKLPTTAAPSPAAFTAAFEAAFLEGAGSIVCICVSSQISATCNAALAAAETFPGKDIRVVDSLELCMGQGFMVLAAAQAAQEGAGPDEVVAQALALRPRMHTFAVLPTLKYLAMGGRVGKFAAGMADTFNIRPLLTVKEGKLDLLEKVRTTRKATDRLLELLCQAAKGRRIAQLALIHVNNLEGAAELEARLRRVLTCPAQAITAEFSPGLSVHAGEGVVGAVLLLE